MTTTKQVMKAYKDEGTGKGIFHTNVQPHEFDRFRGTTTTHVRPDKSYKNFDLTTTGSGTHNQMLVASAHSKAVDIPSDAAAEAKKIRRNHNIAAAIGAIGSAALTVKGVAQDRPILALGGLLATPVIGLGGHVLGVHKSHKRAIDSLSPDQKKMLLDIKENFGKKVSKNPSSAPRLQAHNTYYV